MGIGASIFLIAVGAILAFAVDVQTNGVDLDTIGVILMVVGAIGLLLSMLFWSDWAPARRRRYVDVDDRPVTRRRVYDDDVL